MGRGHHNSKLMEKFLNYKLGSQLGKQKEYNIFKPMEKDGGDRVLLELDLAK